MKKRIVSLVVAMSLLCGIVIPQFSGLADGMTDFEKEVEAVSTLDDAIKLGESVLQTDYTEKAWERLQTSLTSARVLTLRDGYYVICADVDAGHYNENRYLSRIGSNGNNGGTYGVLRYKGHGTAAAEKEVFDDDQIWQLVYTDTTRTTFTLCNNEGNYLRVSGKSNGGRMVRVAALSTSSVSDAYFLKSDVQTNGSCVLSPIDQTAYSGLDVDFTWKTHENADTAASRPKNFLLAREKSAITGKNRCIFTVSEKENNQLKRDKETLLEKLKEQLADRIKDIPYDEQVRELKKLEDAVEMTDLQDETYFHNEDWAKLQSKITEAQSILLDGGYYAIRADVEEGHFNENRYLSRIGSSGDSSGDGLGTCSVLRYKGHGETATAETSFDDDQIWHVSYTDETRTYFTLGNKEGRFLRVSNTTFASGFLIRSNGLNTDNLSDGYFFMEDSDENGSCILRVFDQDIYTGCTVDFTRNTHLQPDLKDVSRSQNVMTARRVNDITERNRCVFEPIAALNAELEKHKEDLLEEIKTLLLKKMDQPLNAESVTSLAEAISVAQTAKQSDYSESTWIELQETLAEAGELVVQQGQYVIGAGVEEGHHNEGRYITASGGHFDAYMTLRYRGKGEDKNAVSAFSDDQIWEMSSVPGLQDVYTFINVKTGGILCGGNAVGGVGLIVSAYAEPASPERAYWTIKNDLLYLVNQDAAYNQAVDFTKVTDVVPDTQKQPRLNNYFNTKNASSITYPSKPLLTRLDNSYNSNLDVSKQETMTRIVNILRRVNGSSLGNLCDLYNDIIENDSALNYNDSDYEKLKNTLVLSLATLQCKLYRIEIGENAAWADTDGYVKFSKIDSLDLSQLWSRETVMGSTDKDRYYSFRNALYDTCLYQSDEQNPAYRGITDFGCYIKHISEDQLADEDSTLFVYSEYNNLMPKKSTSAVASDLSITFAETGGEKKVFTVGGQSAENAVTVAQVNDIDVIMYIAEECYNNLLSLRAKRNAYSETFDVSSLSQLTDEAKAKLTNSSGYSDQSVETLADAYENALAVLEKDADGEHISVSEWNTAGTALKAAISGLTDNSGTANTNYKQVLLSSISLLKEKTAAVDDAGELLYCEPCVKNALQKIDIANKVLSDASATYEKVDETVALLQKTLECMVLEKHYALLFKNLEGVRYRDAEQYQPDTWNALYNYYTSAQKVYDEIWLHTNSELVELNAGFTDYVHSLQQRATLTILRNLLNLLDNLSLKQNDFTPETWCVFQGYYQKAAELLKNANAQQGTIDTVVNSLAVAASELTYKDSTAKLGLLPEAVVGYPNNAKDRYDEGYILGKQWGGYDGYTKSYDSAYQSAYSSLKDSYEPEEVETPVHEITKTVETIHEHLYQPGGIPKWLIYVIIAAGVVLLIGSGVVGVIVYRKKKDKTASDGALKGEAEA